MAQYDLLPTMTRYLDPHLAFPLLEFVQSCEIYNEDDVLRAKIELLKSTNMVDYAIDIYQSLHNSDGPSSELMERRKEVLAQMQELQEKAQPIMEFIMDPAKVESLRGDRQHNSAYMQEQYGIGTQQVDALYNFAKMKFECGNYQAAAELLHQYRTYSMDSSKSLAAIWGKLASEVLMSNYDSALETLQRLRETIDTHLFTDALKQLQQRTWMLHWSLFVFWNLPDGPSQLVDTFLQDRFSVALRINAPHLLRYLVAAHLVTKGSKDTSPGRWQSQLAQLRSIIVSEEYHYADPVTDFVKAVYCDFDFDRAQEKLRECEVLIDGDYFLTSFKGAFLEQARMAIFEVYCRIHQCIDLNALSEQLSMTRENAEVWIAQLIQNARLNARIDSSAGTVVMGTQFVDPLDAIMQRTNNLSVRTFKVANAIIDASVLPAAAQG